MQRALLTLPQKVVIAGSAAVTTFCGFIGTTSIFAGRAHKMREVQEHAHEKER
jgi:hypothetical protein